MRKKRKNASRKKLADVWLITFPIQSRLCSKVFVRKCLYYNVYSKMWVCSKTKNKIIELNQKNIGKTLRLCRNKVLKAGEL